MPQHTCPTCLGRGVVWSNTVRSNEPRQREFIRSILDQVCEVFEIPVQTLLSRDRTPEVASARQAAMYLVRTYTDLSSVEIGRLFRRDHSTVLAGVRRVKEDAKLKRRADSAMSFAADSLNPWKT